jgi:hypothetical protein|tara:strand:- start:105 stop:680 length:576 start_codon:yes stop_codon:yes gene_type:complete
MAEIVIRVGAGDDFDEENRVDTDRETQATVSLDVRKTLGGDLVVYDHEDVDIVISPKTKTVVAFAKDEVSDIVYDAQSRFFDYMVKKGVIKRESVQGGNVYGSMQGDLEEAEAEGVDAIQVAILNITKFMEEEAPRFMYQRMYDEQEEEAMTNPDEEDSTELGEVPHKREKGAIRPGIYRNAYMHNRFYRA